MIFLTLFILIAIWAIWDIETDKSRPPILKHSRAIFWVLCQVAIFIIGWQQLGIDWIRGQPWYLQLVYVIVCYFVIAIVSAAIGTAVAKGINSLRNSQDDDYDY